MLQNIVIIGFCLMVISASFLIGFFVGLKNALDLVEDEPEVEQRLHCFECEIDMPVKEKNGRFYCSNCGLYHGTKV